MTGGGVFGTGEGEGDDGTGESTGAWTLHCYTVIVRDVSDCE